MCIISLNLLRKSFSVDCQIFKLSNLEFVMHVMLGSNIAHLSPVAIHGELFRYFSLFMLISTALWPFLLFLGPGIFRCFFMISIKNVGVFPCKKSNAFPVFQKFKPLVEKVFGKSIITLRSNNGLGGDFVLMFSLASWIHMASNAS